MNELDLTKTMDFEVVGDIKLTIIEVIGYYHTYMSSDCDLHLQGAVGISLPAYYPYLTYYGCFANESDKKLIQKLWDRKLIKLHEVRK